MKKHHVMYVPGLGDHRARGQELAVGLWRIYGVQTEVVRMHWRDGKPFGPKLDALLGKIDAYTAKGDSVSLVAASAGASVAVAAYAARKDKLAGIVLVCGKVRNPQNMHPSVFRKNNSFSDSMALLPASLGKLTVTDRARIMTIHPLADESVPVRDTHIDGSEERTISVVGHAFGIGYSILFYAPVLLHFLKRQEQSLAIKS